MQRFGRTFESEKHQLQELNDRLSQYLCRTKQLEDENSCLITEINTLRQARTAGLEKGYMSEMRELRRMVGQLSFEKSQAEMERERLWREVQTVQSLRREETEVCQDIGGALKGCEKELRHGNESHVALDQRLFQLENEYEHLEEKHRHETAHLRRQLDSRVVPIMTRYHQEGGPVVSPEEVQQFARSVSEGWMDTFEMYQHQVEEIEQSIQSDRAMLDDLQKEKMLYAADFDKLRIEAHKQSQIQVHLEEQLGHMQDRFRMELSDYQSTIEELEHERNMLADSMEAKLWDHQQLLRVKMDLGMEVAAYRSLLEANRGDVQETHRMGNQRERIIEIKRPSLPYTQRAGPSTRQHLDVRYTELASTLRRSPGPASGSMSPSRVIPISVSPRGQHQSPAARRDMLSFNKARVETSTAATAAATPSKPAAKDDEQSSRAIGRKAKEEQIVRVQTVTQVEKTLSPVVSNTEASKSMRTVSPPMVRGDVTAETEGEKKVRDEMEERVCVSEGDLKGKRGKDFMVDSSEKKLLDSVTMEDIISQVMRPAGMDPRGSPAGDSPLTYHVEKTEQEDGSTKTQIILESKVEEELDLSQDFALDALLGGGETTISLEDIQGTPTGSMIQELLSGLRRDEGMANKSVNIQIMETPLVDDRNDAEQDSSVTYCQVEDIEVAPCDVEKRQQADCHTSNISNTGTVEFIQGDEFSRSSKETDSPYYGHDEGSQEYFVSTPDENLSELDEGLGIGSYGHYANLEDLSDERYYQDEGLAQQGMIAEEVEEYELSRLMSPNGSYVKERFPECIIEEEVQVSPTVQDEVLGFLKEESLDPKEQLEGALDSLQDSVSGPLKEELAYFTRLSRESPQNMSVDVKRVQHTKEDGSMTITAELNISQSLAESGLLEEEEGDLSEEQILASLQVSNPGLQALLTQGGAQGYSFQMSEEQQSGHAGGPEDMAAMGGSVTQTTERYIKLGPEERSFTFQKEVDQTSSGHMLQSHMLTSPIEISHEKKVATVYLESSTDD
ncbi:unnamed protein product [Gadus morhua 'NCC']